MYYKFHNYKNLLPGILRQLHLRFQKHFLPILFVPFRVPPLRRRIRDFFLSFFFPFNSRNNQKLQYLQLVAAVFVGIIFQALESNPYRSKTIEAVDALGKRCGWVLSLEKFYTKFGLHHFPELKIIGAILV